MKKKTKKQINKYGSILTGIGLGILIGWYVSGFFAFKSSLIILSSISVLFFGFLAYHKPIFSEYLAYAISLFFILQFSWDYRVGDISNIRTTFFTISLILLILNITTGRVKLIGAKKTVKRAIGL